MNINYKPITNYGSKENVDSSKRKIQEEIFTKYYKKIVSKYYKTIRNQFICEDLALEVIEKILKALPSYKDTSPMDAWVSRISGNHLIDYYRKNATNKNSVERFTGYGDYPTSVYEQHMESFDESNDLLADITDEIEKLPLEDKFIIKNIAFMNLSYDEVGQQLNLSARTVKNRMHKIKKKIKDKIKDLSL